MPSPAPVPGQTGSINWTALISGLVSIASTITMATGHPVAGALIASPDTANAVTGIVGGLGALVAMFAPSVVKSVG